MIIKDISTFRSSTPYGLSQVADTTEAVQYIEQHGNVIELLIDSALCTGTPAVWLVDLRTALAGSGLPGLFVLREGQDVLQALLDRSGGMYIGLAEVQTDALVTAVNHLLQGVHSR